jgi:hypothetical protein
VRYKVRAPDDASYQALLRELDSENAIEVLVTSPRRRLIGTGDLSESWRATLEAQGAQITEDRQYDLE